MNNSGMELNAILHAPDAPDVPGKKDPLVKRGDVFKNPDGSRIVVERVDHNSGDSIVYSSKHISRGEGSSDRRILARPLKNFLVHVGVEEMEAIDPIQNREPLFYEAYEKQMEMLENAFAREFYACERALDTYEESLSGEEESSSIALGLMRLNRQRMNEIANEWEKTNDRLVRGGRRRLALLSEIRNFSREKFEGDLLKWRDETFTELTAEYGTDEPDSLLVERGYFREVLRHTSETLLRKCHRSRAEGISLLEFEREVRRLQDSVVGYDPQDSEKESPVEYIKEVLDTLGKMDREAFHVEGTDGEDNTHSKKKGALRRMKKDESEGSTVKKSKGEKGGAGKKERNRRVDKRTIMEGDDSPITIPPTISENGVQLGGGAVATPVSENIQTQQPMKNPGESISAAEKSTEKESELLRAFKEVAKGEEERILKEIQNAKTFKALKGIGFLVGKRRYFLEATGEDITPALKEGIEAITNKKGGSEDARNASVFLTAVNQTLEDAWKARRNELPEKKPSRATQEDSESPEAIFSELVKVLGKRQDPFQKDDKEVVIELVTSEQIVFRYRNNETEGKWKIGKIKSPQAKRFAEELQKNFGFELGGRKSSKKDKDKAKTTDNGDQVIRGQSDAPTSTPVGNPGDQPPLPGAEAHDADGSVSSLESYDTLLLKLGESPMKAALEKKRLDGVVAAGFQEIFSSFSSEDEMKVFVRESRIQLVQILSESIMIRLQSFSWDTETKERFAREFSERSLDDFIK